MSEGILKVVDAINAVGAAARSATAEIKAAVDASNGRTGPSDSGGGGSGSSGDGRTGPGAGKLDRGNNAVVIDNLKALGGRT